MKLFLQALLTLPIEDITYDNNLYLRNTEEINIFLSQNHIAPEKLQKVISVNQETWLLLPNGFNQSLVLEDEYPDIIFQFISYDHKSNTFAYKSGKIYLKIPMEKMLELYEMEIPKQNASIWKVQLSFNQPNITREYDMIEIQENDYIVHKPYQVLLKDESFEKNKMNQVFQDINQEYIYVIAGDKQQALQKALCFAKEYHQQQANIYEEMSESYCLY